MPRRASSSRAGHRSGGAARPPASAPPPAAARSAVRAASNATLPPPTTTSRWPRSARKPWLTLRRNSTARSTPSSSWPGRSRSRPRPVPTDRNSDSWRVEQLLERRVAADAERQLDVDAELDDRVDLAGDEPAGEAVLRDAEHHHPAEPVGGFVDRDRVTGEAQLVRGAESGRPAADHADRAERRRRHRAVGLVPDGARREALHAEPLGDESLQRADRDRRVDGAPPARRLARRGAHPSADRGERVRRPGDQVRVAVATLGDRGDVGAGVGVHRAGGAARLVVPQPLRVRDGGPRHSDQLPRLQPAQHATPAR